MEKEGGGVEKYPQQKTKIHSNYQYKEYVSYELEILEKNTLKTYVQLSFKDKISHQLKRDYQSSVRCISMIEKMIFSGQANPHCCWELSPSSYPPSNIPHLNLCYPLPYPSHLPVVNQYLEIGTYPTYRLLEKSYLKYTSQKQDQAYQVVAQSHCNPPNY